jgi:hypothetical protein
VGYAGLVIETLRSSKSKKLTDEEMHQTLFDDAEGFSSASIVLVEEY